jgi:mono/diheme cytochrome c family protein
MPAFKSIYSADDLNDVTAYIQTLQAAPQPPP